MTNPPGGGPAHRAGFVVALADLDPEGCEIVGLVGGKAANLSALIRAGCRVPDGVCVTTAAYRAAVGDDPLRALGGAGLDGASPPARARAAVLARPIPADVEAAVRDTCPDGPVAVRSSATAEDLPDASFAGQQDTFLQVVGPDAVLDAVRRCWASLWSDRAVAYREAHGVPHGDVAIAVVVQRMVDAVLAGVMFTANPVTGRRHEAVIDAAAGLGEAVVSGVVDPDHVVVGPDGAVRERRSGGTGVVVRARAGGGTDTVPTAADDPRLSDDDARRLATTGAAVEELFGAPQDIEWAQDAAGGQWLTQSRPVTTLYPVVPGGTGPGRRAFLSVNVAQGVLGPLTPMGVSAARLLGSGAADLLGFPVGDDGPSGVAVAGSRVFVDVTGVLRSRVGRAGLFGVLGLMEARSAAVFRALADDPDFGITRWSPLPAARRIGGIAVRHRIPVRMAAAVADPAAGRARARHLVETLGAELPAPAGATVDDRLDRVRWILRYRFAPVAPRIAPAALAGLVAIGVAARLLRGDARPGELGTVLRGLPHNVTTEMDLELWALAVRLRGDPATVAALDASSPEELGADRAHWPSALADGLGAFLARWGDRAVAEIDLGVPRWSEDPSYLLGVLGNYLRLDDPAVAPDAVFARGAGEAEAMIATLTARAGGWRGRLAGRALRTAREFAGLRELPKFWLVTVLGAARRELAAVGADLVARGRLEHPGDVFFLDLEEAGRDVDHRATVTRRRAEYDRERSRRHVPRVVLSDGTEPETLLARTAPDGALAGTPASAGVLTGPVRVVLDPRGAQLSPGDVLVCPSTDPGWTPLFLTAGALVMEMGGANSHGAVVAREYGLPAVVGVPDAVTRLTGVAAATVDGSVGTVEPLDAVP